MRNIWVISDTHFFHKNVLTFRDSESDELVRPGFANVAEMNECICDNWNANVKQGDIIYHLGDVAFNDPDCELPALMAKLNGSKRLIVGNHDNIKSLVKAGYFKKVQMWRMFPELNMLFTHVPVHPASLKRGGPLDPDAPIMTNVHGHIHQRPSPPGHYFNACVEALNYTPIHVDEIAARIRAKEDDDV